MRFVKWQALPLVILPVDVLLTHRGLTFFPLFSSSLHLSLLVAHLYFPPHVGQLAFAVWYGSV